MFILSMVLFSIQFFNLNVVEAFLAKISDLAYTWCDVLLLWFSLHQLKSKTGRVLKISSLIFVPTLMKFWTASSPSQKKIYEKIKRPRYLNTEFVGFFALSIKIVPKIDKKGQILLKMFI